MARVWRGGAEGGAGSSAMRSGRSGNQLARKLLHDGDAQGAYAVVAAHGQTEPGIVVEAEFLAGFIALRRLNDPKLRGGSFQGAGRRVARRSDPVPGVLLARAGQARRRAAMAMRTMLRAATWPMTFYGQLAARAAGQPDAALVPSLRVAPTPSPGIASTPVTTELARAANATDRLG